MNTGWLAYIDWSMVALWWPISGVLFAGSLLWLRRIDAQCNAYFDKRQELYENQIRDAELSRLRARDRSQGRGFTGNRRPG